MRILGVRDLAGVQEPRAYLTTVAKGVLVNWYKRQALERAYLEALAALPEPVAPSPEQRPGTGDPARDRRHAGRAAAHRAAHVLLSQLDGMKYEDIAQQLEVSLTSVKRYMAQAFRQCLVAMA